MGMTTPKQVARSLTKYAKKNPEKGFYVFVIPQVPGEIPRSHGTDGVMESLVKSKKYVVPLAVFYPEFTAVLGAAYLTDGRFSPPKDAVVVTVPGEDTGVAERREERRERAGDKEAGSGDGGGLER